MFIYSILKLETKPIVNSIDIDIYTYSGLRFYKAAFVLGSLHIHAIGVLKLHKSQTSRARVRKQSQADKKKYSSRDLTM